MKTIVSLVDIPNAHILKGQVFQAVTLGDTALIELEDTSVFLGSGEFIVRPKYRKSKKQHKFKRLLKVFGI